ncbi:MAG TPA: GyrI-like domain-containing protein [Candidatus Bathyarchaeia archaeon]|nr:GyrI-like domain-containing protein [Candidatus Bathyarchaeia archaeon]
MVVDIVLKREPAHNVVSKTYTGPYTGDNMLRPEFDYLSKWLDSKDARTGKWFRIELDKYEVGAPSNVQRQWWACIELKQKPRSKTPSDIEVKTLPSLHVASVTFDPKQFSDRLVYHGLECWLDWRTKFGEYEEAGPTREIYTGNPWTDKKAQKHIELQVPIRKLSPTSKRRK